MATYLPLSTPISPADPVTVGMVAPIPIPSHDSGCTFSVQVYAILPGVSPATALMLLRDISTYPKWSNFWPKAELTSCPSSNSPSSDPALAPRPGLLSPGMEFAITTHMEGDGLNPANAKKADVRNMQVIALEAITSSLNPQPNPNLAAVTASPPRGYRIAWKTLGWAAWKLKTERVIELFETADGGTSVQMWETYGGVLGPVVKLNVGNQLVERFGDYWRDVRRHLCAQ